MSAEWIDKLLSKLDEAQELVLEVRDHEIISGTIANDLQEISDLIETVRYRLTKVLKGTNK